MNGVLFRVNRQYRLIFQWIDGVAISTYLEPLKITSKALAEAMGVHRNTLSNLINGGVLTAPIAIKLSVALGNTPSFWLNIQHSVDLWDTRNRYSEESENVTPLVFNVS